MLRPELPYYQTFDRILRAWYAVAFALFPAAHLHNPSEVLLRTLGTLTLAVQAQGLPTDASPTASSGIVSLIAHAGIAVQIILSILLLFSAISWGIIIFKKRQFRRASTQTAQFLETFR